MEDRLKIALCFSGQPRNVRKCQKIISRSLIENSHEVDVYAHLWWDPSYKNEIIRFEMNNRYEEDEDKVFIDLYKPKKILLEKQKNFDVSHYRDSATGANKFETNVSAFNNISMWYSIQKSFELALEQNVVYDMYVRCRTDLVFMEDVKWEELDSDVLYVGDGRIAGYDRMYGDWFAASSLAGMKKYVSIGSKFEEFNSPRMMHMHDFMKKCLIDCNTKIDNDKFSPELSMMIPEINSCLDNEGSIEIEKFRSMWKEGKLRESLQSIPVQDYEHFPESYMPHYWKRLERQS